ncbi:MGMT family protein [Halorhabdus amylolytica]|uniref:MGMT family protein n=1 Tax=Halorhabdus amylolytica TaxID=2559573 RepID=UPI0010AA0A95|nr:MGMT family protein [Halorhabdus amylolytica]
MDETSGIVALEVAFLNRAVQLGIASGRVIDVSFPDSTPEDADDESPLFEEITAYFEGAEIDFASVEVGLTMATDRREVLETLRSVPYGEEINVEQLTRMTPGLDPEREEDVSLVRTALAENPVPLFVPDHRVRDGPSGAPPAVEQQLRSIEGLG